VASSQPVDPVSRLSSRPSRHPCPGRPRNPRGPPPITFLRPTASFMVMPRRPVAITQSSPCRGRRFFADANNMGRQSSSDCAERWMERDRPSSSSRSAGLAKVKTRSVPSANLLKSLAGATGLEPPTSGVTGRQFCNDFNVSWNVFWSVTGYKAGKSSNRLPCPLLQFAGQKPSRRRSPPERRNSQTRIHEPPACGRSILLSSSCHATKAARDNGPISSITLP
jgi:hypothetical protein